MSGPVIITYVYGVRYNTCNHFYVDPFVLARTRYGDYKYCTDQCLKNMVQIDIDPFVNVRVITELLHNTLSDRNVMDR